MAAKLTEKNNKMKSRQNHPSAGVYLDARDLHASGSRRLLTFYEEACVRKLRARPFPTLL